jgi:hypothetical protein
MPLREGTGSLYERYDCDKCGEECNRDEVDVGVGVITGPWGCPGCGWSEDEAYDLTNPDRDKHDPTPEGWRKDQYGGLHSLKRDEEIREAAMEKLRTWKVTYVQGTDFEGFSFEKPDDDSKA